MSHYQVTNDGSEEEIDIQPSFITISTSSRGSSQGGGATTLTHADFLAGAFNDHVRRYFGETVLADVLAQCVDASDDPHGGAVGRDRAMLDAWAAVPNDTSIEALVAGADTFGSELFNWPPAEGAIIETFGATLHLSGGAGVLTRPDRTTCELDWRCSFTAALAFQGRFFVCACDHLTVFDLDGEVVMSTAALANEFGVGTDVRINDVIRAGDDLVFGYWTFAVPADPLYGYLGSSGAIRLDDRGQLIARGSFEPAVLGRRRAQVRNQP